MNTFSSSTEGILYFVSAFIGQDFITKQTAETLSSSYLYQILNIFKW
ncbi:MAG: hypothetical protein L6U99_07365 [Clostridium sp.]|nr:MAG: hypothetical protein L6U99_07365 [Clostridium sp.]